MDMTPQPISRDDFARLYASGQVLVPEGIRTSLAQERSKGRLVMVHELVNSPGERRRVLNLLNQLGAEHRALVLGAFLIDDEPVYVTKFLLGFVSFRQWLEHAVSEKATVLLDTRSDVSELDRSTHDGAPTNLALKTTEVERVTLSLESVPGLEETAVGLDPVPPTLSAPPRAPLPPPMLRTATPPTAPAPPAAPVPGVTSVPVPNASHADTPPPADFSGIFGKAEPPVLSKTAPPAVPTPASPPIGTPPVDDFSGLFGKVAAPSPGPPLGPPSGEIRGIPGVSPAPSPVPPQPGATASTIDELGSFTEFFGGAAGTSAPPVPLVPSPAAPIAAAPVRPPSPISPVAIPTPPALPGLRDLPPTPAPIAASPPPPSPPLPSQDSGGFTELFGGGVPKPVDAPRPPLPPVQQDVRASAAPPPPRINMSGAAVTPPPPRPAAPVVAQRSPSLADLSRPQVPRVPGASSVAPSDFTEMLKPARPPLPSAGPPILPQNPPPAIPAAAKPSMLPLYIVVGVCVMLVIVVLIYAATIG